MMTITIVAEEKKGYVSINGAADVVCPLVKDRENSYSLNIKKLGFARSFISVGALEDKEIELDEASLMNARPSRKLTKGPKVVSLDIPEGVLSDDEFDSVSDAIAKINDFYQAEFDAAQAAKVKAPAAPRTKLTDLEKLERQLQKILAKKEELLANYSCKVAEDSDAVED